MSARVAASLDSRSGEVVTGAAIAAAIGLATVQAPSIGVGSLAIAALFFVGLVRLSYAVSVFTALAFMEQLDILHGNEITGMKAAGAALAVAWLANITYRGGLQRLATARPLLIAAPFALAAWAFASTAWAVDASAAIFTASRLAQGALLVLIVAAAARTKRDIQIISIGYVAGAFITVSLGLAGIATTGSQVGASPRLVGLIGDANDLAAAAVPAVMLCLNRLTVARTGAGRVGLVVVTGVLVTGVLSSASRGGVIALTSGILVMAVAGGRMWRRRFALGVLSAAGAVTYVLVFASTYVTDRLAGLTAGAGSGRLDLWTVAVRMIKDNPFLGVGSGNFRVVEPVYGGFVTRIDLVAQQRELAHNTYLQLQAELGVVGLAAFLVLALGGVKVAREAALEWDRRGDLFAADARGVVVSLVAFLTSAVFLTTMYEKQLWILIGLAIAVGAAARASAPREQEP